MDELDEAKGGMQEVENIYSKAIRLGSEFTELFMSFRNNSPMSNAPQSEQAVGNALTNFTFTGKDTDLCYFNNADSMPLSALANISDPELKNNVIETFDRFEKNGYIKLDGDSISITEKGKNLLSDPKFLKQSSADQIQAYNEKNTKLMQAGNADNTMQMCTALSGDYINDFTFFNHTDQLDLTNIANHPNKKLSSQILDNVKGWQKCGAVTVKDGIATITKQGKEMLNSENFKAISKAIPEKAFSAVKNTTNQIIVPTQKAAAVAVQALKKGANLSR